VRFKPISAARSHMRHVFFLVIHADKAVDLRRFPVAARNKHAAQRTVSGRIGKVLWPLNAMTICPDGSALISQSGGL
jgi:hypothetical protein